MNKALFMACLLLIGTSVMAKPTIEQVKKAIAKPQGVFKKDPCRGYRARLHYIEIVKEGNYNKQYDYYPYIVKVTVKCQVLYGSPIVEIVEARMKIYKDDFDEYIASWY